MILEGGKVDTVFTLRQEGNTVAGKIEVSIVSYFNASGGPITDGKIEGANISFHAGNTTYSGTVEGDRIVLKQSSSSKFRAPKPDADAGPRPVIGPPPNGSDPSYGTGGGSRPPPPTLDLRRVTR